jgi:hypothetical protein
MTLPGPSKTITVEPIEQPRERPVPAPPAPAPAPREPVAPARA